MILSWNEIKDRALAFSKEWVDVEKESAEYQTFWDGFFNVYGISRRSVAAYQRRVDKTGGNRGYIDLLWPGLLLIEHKGKGEDLDRAFSQADEYIIALKDHERPRYVIISDYHRLRLYDTEAPQDSEDYMREYALKDLHKHARAFGFIAGYTQKVYKDEETVNVKAAELVAKLHDALKESGYSGHALEMLLVRLVFCFFADDTDIFGEPSFFRNYIELRTKEDGSDLGPQLALIFQTLNTPGTGRQSTLDEDLRTLPHVDGHLFEEQLPLPTFNTKMRTQLLLCCSFDWSAISPAVFGAMFQSAMNQDERHDLGAHYTSEKNILKVISGLFLDGLKKELETAGHDHQKLRTLQDKIASLTFLDPACGCGNFLVVTYRELRLLELEILKRLFAKAMKGVAMPNVASLSKVYIAAMHGIEIEELPSRIASLALWLTDHQMNMRLREEFGEYVSRLPLPQKATIIRENALRVDWETVVPKSNLRYILGNPPFIAKQDRSDEQTADMDIVCADVDNHGLLDFVCAWHVKAADFIQGTTIECAFVSTNSITQGEQVGVLWNFLFKKGVKIQFAHRTFKWSNEARGEAAVFCTIIGFGLIDRSKKYLYDYETPSSEAHEIQVKNINPYLVDADNVVVTNRTKPIAHVPEMMYGSKPVDDGHLIISDDEKASFLSSEPGAERFVKPLISAEEYLNGKRRWCLWLADANPADFRALPKVFDRIEEVRKFRLASKKEQTRELAEVPYRFAEVRQPESDFVLIPLTTSENRKYVPMDFFSKEYVVLNTCSIVPGAKMYHFGVLESLMHMAWMRVVCGRMKGDYRYSNKLVYNNFPWPIEPEVVSVAVVEKAAQAVLNVRKEFPGSTLADLYDPTTMPAKLLKAHQHLDAAVDACYGQKKGFKSEPERLKFLFSLYQELEEQARHG